MRLRCDGVDHCGDGSDETSCRNCSSGALLCPSLGACLPRAKLCDGRPDCPDGRDEDGVLCRRAAPHFSSLSSSSSSSSVTCGAWEYGCTDGQCVPLSWRCDRSPDCSDGADERDCGECAALRVVAGRWGPGGWRLGAFSLPALKVTGLNPGTAYSTIVHQMHNLLMLAVFLGHSSVQMLGGGNALMMHLITLKMYIHYMAKRQWTPLLIIEFRCFSHTHC